MCTFLCQSVENTKEELEEGLKKELEFKVNQLKALEEAKDDLQKSNEVMIRVLCVRFVHRVNELKIFF